MFSPYYASARRQGPANPENHVAINVALYGKGVRRWTMTERTLNSLTCSREALIVGPSRLSWDRDELEISIDEMAVPFPARVRGLIRLRPEYLPARAYAIDRNGRHTWQPIAPIARIEVDFSRPALRWSGHAYFDHNRGEEPLETAFKSWNWARQGTGMSTKVLYDLVPRGGSREWLALHFERDGSTSHLEPPPRRTLPKSHWRIERSVRCDLGYSAAVARTLEDTPFYTRSVVNSSILGEAAPLLHESLDLDRFQSRVVQAMLPFRMPRRTF